MLRRRNTWRALMQEKRDSKKRGREMRQAVDRQQGEPHCAQCGEGVAPLEPLLSPAAAGACERTTGGR